MNNKEKMHDYFCLLKEMCPDDEMLMRFISNTGTIKNGIAILQNKDFKKAVIDSFDENIRYILEDEEYYYSLFFCASTTIMDFNKRVLDRVEELKEFHKNNGTSFDKDKFLSILESFSTLYMIDFNEKNSAVVNDFAKQLYIEFINDISDFVHPESYEIYKFMKEKHDGDGENEDN